MKLATAKKGNYPLDFGAVVFNGPGNCMMVTRGAYRREWTDFKIGDVTLTDVADDYEIPVPVPVVDPFVARWGKKAPCRPDEFPGMVLTAYKKLYMAQGQSAEDVADRIDRLWNDKRATTIRETVSSPTLTAINPNDAAGNFRKMLTEIRTTKAAVDGLPLLTHTEEAALAAEFAAL